MAVSRCMVECLLCYAFLFILYTAAGGRSIPPEVCITQLQPDIVIIDKSKKSIDLLELTCPLEGNIDKRHQAKCDKYAYFVTDCSSETMKCSVTCFKVSCRGLITPRNSDRLHKLHKYIKKGRNLSTFKYNISAPLSVLSSYHIWLCRSDPSFQEPLFLPSPSRRYKRRNHQGLHGARPNNKQTNFLSVQPVIM